MKNNSKQLEQAATESPPPKSIKMFCHPHLKSIQLQFQITCTHISPLILLKYSKI